MNKIPHAIFAAALLPAVALAVYAPVPEQEQGKALTVRLAASVSHDSNIFGAPSGEIDSMVYSFHPSIDFNSSVTEQTFFSASYEASFDHFVDRPTKRTLSSHTFSARLAHSFSATTTLDVRDSYLIIENPQSLLQGVPINSDQSLKNNQFYLRYATALGQKTGLTFKYRNLDYRYDATALADFLDRNEHLAGLEVSYRMLPETKLVGEYRYQQINYAHSARFKDKESNFLMAGLNYTPREALVITVRAGFEDRTRKSERNTTAPYFELTGHYAYATGSFLSGGYIHTFEEPSDVVRFTDVRVDRFFLNFQHHLSPLVTFSSSLTYEPSQLQGRRTVTDIDETVTRFGLALIWVPNKNWSVAANYDLDHISSDDPFRQQDRNRLGVTVTLAF